jgi:hypothetical protein
MLNKGNTKSTLMIVTGTAMIGTFLFNEAKKTEDKDFLHPTVSILLLIGGLGLAITYAIKN